MSIPAHVKYLMLSLLFIVATVNITKTTFKILASSKRLDRVQEEVLSLEKRKKTLEKDIAYKKTENFIETKAREELNMAKPGEDVFLAPKGLEKIRVLGSSTTNQRSNFQQWIDLFF